MPRKLLDLTGHRYGKLLVLKSAGRDERNQTIWKCLCDCGAESIGRTSKLQEGAKKSCGCSRWEDPNKLISQNPRIVSILKGMRARCGNPNHHAFRHYGGRGIGICSEWGMSGSKIPFIKWALSHGYSDDLSIDRIDNDKNYAPDNCRWATRIEQANNRSAPITALGMTMRPFEWIEYLRSLERGGAK